MFPYYYSFILFICLCGAFFVQSKYDYDHHRDFGLVHNSKSFATNPIQPLSLYNYDITKIVSSSSSSSFIIDPNNIKDHGLYQRHRSALLYNDDLLLQVNDDDEAIQFTLSRKRKPRNHLPSLSVSQQRKEYSTKPLDLAFRTDLSTGIIAENDSNLYVGKQAHQQLYKYKKTGTTIVGISGPNYCILGADTRATSGTMVADKRCWKLHPLSANCAAAGAGTSADLDHITRECYYQTQLWFSSTTSSSSSRQPSIGNAPYTIHLSPGSSVSTMIPIVSVKRICHYLQQRLYEQRGSCQANLIVGGYDVDEGCGVLRAIHPGGSIDIVQYTALGSGSYAAMSILENEITDPSQPHNLTMDEAIALVVKAVKAGIDHDLGSGSQVDLCIISSNGIANYTRCYLPEEQLIEDVRSTSFQSSTNHSIDGSVAPSLESNVRNEEPKQFIENVGSNGFGNVPYTIIPKRRSKRNINGNNLFDVHDRDDDDNDIRARLDQWKDIFGI